jgi:fructokinase
MFPAGKKLGGAPLNFSYHCHQLGAQGYPVSAIGRDGLGIEILAVLDAKGIPREHVAVLGDHPTGTVEVTLDGDGIPAYVITEGVAWDYLPESAALLELAGRADAACFGSLAQRNAVSRHTIAGFLQAMRPESLRICDVNLRQQFYSNAILLASLELCNILKLSDEELPVIAGMLGVSGPAEAQLRAIVEQFDLRLVAYTRGPDGSLLVTPGASNDHSGYPVKAVNSVGAGDSFTAALCMGMLNGESLEGINEHANRVAAHVCTQDTATPELPAELTGLMEALRL